LKQALIEAAHWAACSKNTWDLLQTTDKAHGQQASHRGTGTPDPDHHLSSIICGSDQQSYRELGPGHTDKQAAELSKRWIIRRLEHLGFVVLLTLKDYQEEMA
jgi:hypothetical protein